MQLEDLSQKKALYKLEPDGRTNVDFLSSCRSKKMIVDNVDLNAPTPLTKCFIMIPGTTMLED